MIYSVLSIYNTCKGDILKIIEGGRTRGTAAKVTNLNIIKLEYNVNDDCSWRLSSLLWISTVTVVNAEPAYRYEVMLLEAYSSI